MADERQRAGDEMHDDGTVTSTMTADAIEYTISGEIHSGVGVLDKTVKILDALESGPATLGQLVSATGLARPTAVWRSRWSATASCCAISTDDSCLARVSPSLPPQRARIVC